MYVYLELARRNLGRAKVRSLLAVVGILIGVMAVGSIGIFGESLKAAVLENFENLATELVVSPNYQEGYRYIDAKDAERIEKIPGVKSAVPIRSDALEVEYRGRRTIATVYAMEERTVGRLFEVEKGIAKLKGSCIVGHWFAKMLSLRVGSKLAIEGKEFRVSAILKEEGARFDINPNYAVILSPDDFKRLSSAGIGMVIVRAESISKVEAVKEEIERKLNSREEKVRVLELKSILESINKAFSQINAFLIAIASVSLLVAGVSILNIMLMSTIERTKEIGIMRAIGAYRSTILKIFLAEAAMLGVAGSIVGSILSIFGGMLIDYALLQDFRYVFQPSTAIYVILGLVVGVLTAVLSGLYPAWKASKLEPIEALRYE